MEDIFGALLSGVPLFIPDREMMSSVEVCVCIGDVCLLVQCECVLHAMLCCILCCVVFVFCCVMLCVSQINP